MHPQLFSVLGLGFPAYFVLLITGFLFATTMGALWARRIGQDPDVVIDLGLAMLLAGVVGSRLLHVVADGYFWDYVHLCTDPSQVSWRITEAECASTSYRGLWDSAAAVCHPREQDCFAWARFWAGGLTYYGGFLGASVAAWFLLKRDRFPFWKAADMAGFAIPVGLVFGRMGCLLAGCCFGVQSSSPLALVFPERSPASEWQFKAGLLDSAFLPSLPVLPTQIFESAASLAIVAFCLIWLHPRKRYDGQVFVAFTGLYALARFLLEYLRSDDRGGLLSLSTSQLIGLALIVVAAGLHWARRQGRLALSFAP
jgi:phosphatidylglycerol:prolipoprotein diacylglycerol transferase